LNTGGQVGGRDVTMNGRQQQLQNGKYITKCYRPATNSNGQKKQPAFRKNCCFNKFTTEVESAFAPLFSRCVEGGLTEHKPRLMNALAAIDLHSTPFCTFPIFRGSIISKKIHPGKPHFGYHPTYFPFKRQHGFHFVRKCTYLCGQ